MVEDSKPAKRKQKPNRMKKENSVDELTFSYLFDCLQEAKSERRFLGFTLSFEYVPVHKSRSEELAKLQYYFPMEVLQAVVVWSVWFSTFIKVKGKKVVNRMMTAGFAE